MSKPTARIVLVTLVGIVLIAAAYVTVQGAFAKADSAGAQAHVVSGLQTNFNHDRSTAAELDALQAQINNTYSEPGAGRHQGGGCEHESQSVPLD
jgi:Tfp pilus assembly protein PilO